MSNLPEPTDFRDNAMFDWVDDMPRPKHTKAMMKEQVQQLYHAAGALPYRGEWDADRQMYVVEDPKYVGMTYFEVLVLKEFEAALTEGKARERVMDRILGKPKQALESVSMNLSYTEFLEKMALQHGQIVEPAYVDVDWEDLTDGI